MNIYNSTREYIIAALGELGLPAEVSFDAVTAEPPRDASHGDIATNAAMVVAKPAGKNPREIAEALKRKLEQMPDAKNVEIAGPGFINITLYPAAWQGIIAEVLAAGSSYGNSELGGGEKINVEYVSANPTGPMHIGHARGAVVGDVLATLLIKAGFDVTREYYINDAGAQVDTLAKSAYLRYLAALGEDIGEIPEGLYPGDYLIPIGEGFAAEHKEKYKNADEAEWLPVMRSFAIDSMLALIRHDLSLLGIEHDVFSSEKALIDAGKVEEAIAHLDKKGLIYQGVLEPPKGKTPEDWEPREQTLFRATDFGDDVDRPLKKSDGSGTYFSSDIAYHLDKINRGFKQMALVLGVDHGGYKKRMQAAVKALSNGEAKIEIVLYALVNFLEGGKPMKMSKRKGTYLTVRDVAEAVGKDVIRFIMLTRKNDAVLDFDLKIVREQSKDNPVFYVQYAHARSYSVFKNAQDIAPEILDENYCPAKTTMAKLEAEEELTLMKLIAEWPRQVEAAAKTKEPHRIAFYLLALASAFHSLWNKGKDDKSLRFIIEEDRTLTQARLALVKACVITIASGLNILGVEPVREM